MASKTYTAGQAEVDILPNFEDFVEKLRADLERVDASLSVDVGANTTKASAEIDELTRARIAEIEARILDKETASARLDEVAAARIAEIEARTQGADEKRVQLDEVARARVALIEAKTQAIEEQRARLDDLAREREAKIRAKAEGAGEARAELDSVSSSGRNARGSLVDLNAVSLSGIIGAVAALAAGIGGAIGAVGGLAGVLGGVGAAGVIGSHGIADAFKAQKTATDGASEATRKHVDDLNSVIDAQQRVADSQHNEGEALQRVEDAQKSLTQARKDAKDTVDNLNLAVQDGALSERGAEIAYRRAVQNLQRVKQARAVGAASQLDLDSAQLDVDQARQRVQDTHIENKQTQAKAADANTKGVDNADNVVAAQKQLEQAQYGVQQAQVQTAQAVRELAKAQQEAAKSGTEAAGGSDKLAQAMAKLSPNAQQFVRQMLALGPAWTDMRKAVQDNLFAGLGDTITKLSTDQLPHLKDGLGQIATGLNGALRDTAGQLNSLFSELAANGTWQAFIDGVNQAMQGLAPMVTGLTSAFATLGAEVGPSLGTFFGALGPMIAQIAGPLGNLGAAFLDALTPVLPTLTQLITALAQNLQPILPVIGTLLTAVGNALIPLAGPLANIAGIIGNALATAINAIAPFLPAIAKAFADVLTAVSPLIDPLAQIIGLIAGAVAQNVSALATALQPVVKAFADGLQPVIPVLANAFQQMAPVLAQVATTFGQAMAQAMQKIAPVLPQLVESFVKLLVALTPLLPPLAEIGGKLLVGLAEILVKLAPQILQMVDVFTKLVSFVVEQVVPQLRNMSTIFSDTWDVIKKVWDGMTSGLDTLHSKFDDIIGKIRKLWTDLVDDITKPFKDAGSVTAKVFGHVIDALPGFADGGGPVSGPGTSTSDSILARLSNGEYVVNAEATAKHRPLIEAINSGSLPGFADGGSTDGQLPQKYSLPGILGNAGTILGQGILGFFGLENSALSDSNVYNQAIQKTSDYYTEQAAANSGDPGDYIPSDTVTPATGDTSTDSKSTADNSGTQATKTSTDHTYVPGAGVEQWRGTFTGVLQTLGLSTSEWLNLGLSQMNTESGGNPRAINNWDSNAAAGTPSKGLMQVIDPTFASYHSSQFPGDIWDPAANIAASVLYTKARYGSPSGTWGQGHGYADGGWAFGPGTSRSDSIPARLSDGEFVVNAPAAAANAGWLNAINSGARLSAPGVASAAAGGKSVRDHSVNFNGDVQVMNHDELIRSQDRWTEQQSMAALAAYS